MTHDTTADTADGAQADNQTVGTKVETKADPMEYPEGIRRFTIYTEQGEADQCSCPGCEESPSAHRDDCNLGFEADLQGMAADFGTLTFCSEACARTVSEMGSLTVVGEWDTHIYATEPVVVRVFDKWTEPVYTCVAHNTSRAFEKASEEFEVTGMFGRKHQPDLRDSRTIEVESL